MNRRSLPYSLSTALFVLVLSAMAIQGCKKKSTPPPTPTPVPTATPGPGPSPTPTPIPGPTPFPDCIEELSDDPVPLPKHGTCPSGFEARVLGYNLSPGSPYREEVCIPKSSCERRDGKKCEIGEGKDITYRCSAMADLWEYIMRDGCNDGHQSKPCAQGGLPFGLTYDIDRGYFDAYGRKYSQHVSPPSADSYFGPWKWAGYCPPRFCNDKPIGTVCNNPVPPYVARFEWEVVGQNHEGWQIDVTPIVCDGPAGSPTAGYCARVWNGTRTGCCPVRPPEDEMREACENEIMGHDVNQNRGGPIFMETEAYVDKRDPRYDFRATVWFPGGTFKICTRRQPRVCTDAILR